MFPVDFVLPQDDQARWPTSGTGPLYLWNPAAGTGPLSVVRDDNEEP
jgi:hypothetical protein